MLPSTSAHVTVPGSHTIASVVVTGTVVDVVDVVVVEVEEEEVVGASADTIAVDVVTATMPVLDGLVAVPEAVSVLDIRP